MDSLRILQWNCYSVLNGLPDLNTLASSCSPDVILLQETWLSAFRSFSLPGFHACRLDRPAGCGGGLLTLVSTSLIHSSSVFYEQSSLGCEVLGVRLASPSLNTFIINVYCPGGFLSAGPVDAAVAKASGDVLVAGDFNSHHVQWGHKTDSRGRDLWAWICQRNLSVANDGSSTFLRGTARSAIDLTLCSPRIKLSSWRAIDSSTNSDYLTIYFELLSPVLRTVSVRSHCNRSLQEKKLASLLAGSDDLPPLDKAISSLSSLSQSLQQSTFRVEKRTSSSCAPWWTGDCTRAFRRRKAAWKQVLANTCYTNWTHFQRLKALYKRTIAAAKRDFYSGRNSFLSAPNCRKALHRHIAFIRRSFSTAPPALTVLSDADSSSRLEGVARGLAQRFSNAVAVVLPALPAPSSGFHAVSPAELECAVRALPNSAPGPDGGWRRSRIVVVQKVSSRGLSLDNIRPIYTDVSPFLECQIPLARERGFLSGLVALDVAKAYDSVEHSVLLQELVNANTPPYLIAWVMAFLCDRSFFCSAGSLVSSSYPQSRGVPQGSVLCPILFNVLMSSLPCDPSITTFTYADDIAFFASAPSLSELYAKLQAYLDTLAAWMSSMHLSLNVDKSAMLVFPLNTPVTIDLQVGLQSVRQVKQLKYLGMWYDDSLSWRHHIDHLCLKATKAIGVLHRCSSPRVGMRRDALLYVYRSYVRPILEFGAVLFSSLPDWRLTKLYTLERRALRLCLGPPRYSANDALLLEARLPSLKARFRLLTVSVFLSQRQNPIALSNNAALKDARLWLTRQWHRRNTPQLVFAQQLLMPLKVSLLDALPLGAPLDPPSMPPEQEELTIRD
ncbi:uncharacterized protein LOC135398713 [Ornithodoros turicata]|uniref:uncharacterized protein LOC135398713 n=1 Tax=Ornithodoros turicata TaxID=34597 RepID=UPI00313952A4